jgi:hypothetical protein
LYAKLEGDGGKKLQKLVANAHHVGSWDDRRIFFYCCSMTVLSPFASLVVPTRIRFARR